MMQVTKVWWDGEKLMAEPIDPASVYSDIVSDGGLDPRNTVSAQQEPSCKDCRIDKQCSAKGKDFDVCSFYVPPPAQRAWVELTDYERTLIRKEVGYNQFMTAGEYAELVQKATESILKAKNQ